MYYKKRMYAYLHQRIRNDEHCPTCRTYYLTVFENKMDCGMLYEKGNNSVWVDEWIRRRNGDRYTIQPINYEKIYDLNEFDELNCVKIPNMSAKFILIHTLIDKQEYCPNNIKFNVSFYENESEIISSCFKIEEEDDEKKFLETKEFTIIEDSKLEHYEIIKIEFKKKSI
jgi:hypothetical protein